MAGLRDNCPGELSAQLADCIPAGLVAAGSDTPLAITKIQAFLTVLASLPGCLDPLMRTGGVAALDHRLNASEASGLGTGKHDSIRRYISLINYVPFGSGRGQDGVRTRPVPPYRRTAQILIGRWLRSLESRQTKIRADG